MIRRIHPPAALLRRCASCLCAIATLAMAATAARAAGTGGNLPPPGRSEFIVVEPDSPALTRTTLRFREGDDLSWADPALDDSGWEERSYERGLPAHSGVYWVRFRIRQPEPPRRARDGVSIAVVASYALYFDGRLVGRSGVVGATREDEVPGNLDNLFRIPDALLTPGEHVVAIRMSAWRSGFPAAYLRVNFALGDFRGLVERRVRQAIFSVLSLGGALVGCAVFALLWLLVERRRALLLFSGAGLTAASMQALQAWRWLFDYPFDWHYPRMVAIACAVTALGVFLVAALQEFFSLGRRGWRMGMLAVALCAGWLAGNGWYNTISTYVLALSLTIALATVALAVWQRRTGARFVLAGLLVSCAGLMQAPREFLEQSFFITFGAPMFGCLTAVALQLREERRAARRAQLAAARLEIELLKKQIQPHFVMNTLTTIMEVIEQDPKAAVALIEALAGEFRIVARVSSERLIPLDQEIELCRTHLRIMSLRKDVSYRLAVTGEAGRLLVPPGLLLTLVENGLTHAHPRGGEVEFALRIEMAPALTRFVFVAPGEGDAAAAPGEAGTGVRYVKARLEESFAGRWSFEGGAIAGAWRTVIEVRGPRAEKGQA